MTFALVDLPFLVLLLYISLNATYTGLIREVFTKAAFALGLLGGLLFRSQVTSYLESAVKSPFARQILAFLLVFIGIYLVVRIIQHFVSRLFENDIMSGLNRALGFFFGIAESLAVIAAILVLLYAQPWFDTDKVLGLDHSFFVRIVGGLARDWAESARRMIAA
ncbi:MAG: CvpA family protein [Spirochaetaceae bacterium]|jgi:membrane protein required for colicin V production|nr:CvpA family protein [Spirochaetaceae bacterium]